MIEDDPAAVERMLSYLYTLDYDDGWDANMNEVTEYGVPCDFVEKALGARSYSEEGMHPNFNALAPKKAETVGPTAPSDPNNADEQAKEIPADHSRQAIESMKVIQTSANKMATALHNDVLAFAIAHKYDVAELKVLAQDKFSTRAKIFWSSMMTSTLFIHPMCGLIKAVYETTPDGERGLRDVVVLLCSEHINDLVEIEDFRTMTVEVNLFSSDLLWKTVASAKEARANHEKATDLMLDFLNEGKIKISEEEGKSCELEKRLHNAETAFTRFMKIVDQHEKCRHCKEVFRPHPEFDLGSKFKVLRCSGCNTRHHEGKPDEAPLSWRPPSHFNAIG